MGWNLPPGVNVGDIPGNRPGDDDIICDGCNVRPPHEHRCHGKNARVFDENAGGPCTCQDEACRMVRGESASDAYKEWAAEKKRTEWYNWCNENRRKNQETLEELDNL